MGWGEAPPLCFELRAPPWAWQPGSGSEEVLWSHLPPTGTDTHGGVPSVCALQPGMGQLLSTDLN